MTLHLPASLVDNITVLHIIEKGKKVEKGHALMKRSGNMLASENADWLLNLVI